MPIEALFVAIGYQPNTDARSRTGSSVDRGRLHQVVRGTDAHRGRGGLRRRRRRWITVYRQAVTAAADGCKAAIDAERWLESEGIAEAATATAW